MTASLIVNLDLSDDQLFECFKSYAKTHFYAESVARFNDDDVKALPLMEQVYQIAINEAIIHCVYDGIVHEKDTNIIEHVHTGEDNASS